MGGKFYINKVLLSAFIATNFVGSVFASAQGGSGVNNSKELKQNDENLAVGLKQAKVQERNIEEKIDVPVKDKNVIADNDFENLNISSKGILAGTPLKNLKAANNVNNLPELNLPTKIKRIDIFKAVTGVDEEEFRSNEDIIRKCIKKDKDGNFYIVNYKTGVKTLSGNFKEISLNELDEKLKNYNFPGKGSFNTISLGIKYKNAPENLQKKVDASALQADDKNTGKAFVVSSNFNVLETLGKFDNVSNKKVGDYVGDLTQGPYAALSAVAGTIFRTYYMYYDETKPPKKWRQTEEKQINTLSGLNINTKNGYITDDADTVYKKLTKEGAKGHFKIGYHKNIQVSAGYFGPDPWDCCSAKQEYFNDSSKIIDQIYLAAVDMNTFYSSYDIIKNQKIAKTILEWNYEAIIKSAIANGKKEVILPLCGCHVFGNKPMWHVEAIEKNLDLIKKVD